MPVAERPIPSVAVFDRAINGYANTEPRFIKKLSSAYGAFFGALGEAIPEGHPGFKIDRYNWRHTREISYITVQSLDGCDLIRRLHETSHHWEESRVLSLIAPYGEVDFRLAQFKSIEIASPQLDYVRANLPGAGFGALEFLYGPRTPHIQFFEDLSLVEKARVFSGMMKVAADLAEERLNSSPSVAISA